MELTSKERARLRGLANSQAPTHYVGREGITPEFTESVDAALERRELVKIGIQKSRPEEPKALADTLAGRTRSQVVSVVGGKFVLYRKNKDKT